MTERNFENWFVVGWVGDGFWWCRCKCGIEKQVKGHSLRAGTSVGCFGCRKGKPIKHGLSRDPDRPYTTWRDMIVRCHDSNHGAFKDYGGRGVFVCARWRSIAAFYADMGPRPSKGHKIDRIDNDGGYWCGKLECPECGSANRKPNCRWATQKEQSNNRRNNKRLTIDDVTKTYAEWADVVRCRAGRIGDRLRAGWNPRDAVFLPAGSCKPL